MERDIVFETQSLSVMRIDRVMQICYNNSNRRQRVVKWTEPSERIFYINKNVTAIEKDKADFTTMSEYHIGHTIYRVKTVFNPAFRQSLSDILARLITEDCEKMFGESGQEQDKQAV